MQQMGDALKELEERLERYPEDRYPVQHGVARFHLGAFLTQEGRPEAAIASLEVAVRLFPAETMPVEHAKALNALGAARHAAGREAAEAAFARAAALFAEANLALEHGAALYNLGLARRAAGRRSDALDALRAARALLDPAVVPAQAAAVAREVGEVELELGELDAAVADLTEAAAGARRAGDLAGVGAAENALGLAHLARGAPDRAAEAFRSAAGAHPRAIRPQGFAMAKANLALAHERAARPPHARLAAAQALAAPDVPSAVEEQARGVLERLGAPDEDLATVVGEVPPDERQAILRDELVRWAATNEDERRRASAAWISAQAGAGAEGVDLAHAWIGALFELPPEDMEAILRSCLQVSGGGADEVSALWAQQMSRAMARFHIPQWMRLKETLNRLAAELGQERSWT